MDKQMMKRRSVAGWLPKAVGWLGSAVFLGLLAGCPATMNQLTAPSNAAQGSAGPAVTSRPTYDGPAAEGALPYTAAPASRASASVPRSGAEKQLAEDSDHFKSVVFGGILDTVMKAGPLAIANCYARYSRNEKARNDCMALSALTITSAGFARGYAAAKLDQAGQNKVKAAQLVTADMQKDNDNLQAVVNSSQAVLEESQARLTKLRSDVLAKRMALDQARQEAQREEENLATLKTALANAKTTRDNYAKAAQEVGASGAQKKDLDAQIAQMNTKIRALENNIKKLTDAMVPFAA